jgi:hypothetical protein
VVNYSTAKCDNTLEYLKKWCTMVHLGEMNFRFRKPLVYPAERGEVRRR